MSQTSTVTLRRGPLHQAIAAREIVPEVIVDEVAEAVVQVAADAAVDVVLAAVGEAVTAAADTDTS